MSTQSFSWLHLSDFHFGLAGQNILWPNLRQPFLDDLAVLHKQTGPWDAVFFTGDLVQQGKPEEFDDMQKEVLNRLREKLTELGSGNAVLLAVPGNHDLCRPDPKADNPAVDKLLESGGFNSIATKFWGSPTNSYRQVISDAFAAYTNWWNATDHRPQDLTTGELPGDFACTLECNEHRIGIVGLNTAFLQLQGGDYKEKLIWSTQQLQKVCGGAADDWLQRHSLCLLLTHQGPDWLTPEARKHGESEISPAGRFALHLYGHMHEGKIQYIRTGGNSDAIRLCQSCSVFGMEKFGEPPTLTRNHGYTVGRIEFAGNNARFRCWPRIATNNTGPWRFVSDNQNSHLEDDQGTAPETLALRVLKKNPVAPSITVSVAPMLQSKPVAKRTFKLYGRGPLLHEAATKLGAQSFLMVYGMRGNGKTAFIDALSERAPLLGKEHARIAVDPSTTADYVFRQIARLLGETAELPKAPNGDAAAIAAEIKLRYPNPRPAWIWLENAHHLFGPSGFRSTEIRNLLAGMQLALGTQWHWLLELRERPPLGVFGTQCEVPGLDKASLSEWLIEAAPAGSEADWTYKGDQLRAIYQWLGTGHANRAHPLATQILVEVAHGLNETPLQVLQRHREHLDQGIENRLLGDLYANVLGSDEQNLICGLALYRTAIPHDHLEKLETCLEVSGAWDGLDRRCLLSSNADHSKFYLHSFIATWLRTRQLGYAGHGEDSEAEFSETTTEPKKQAARSLHSFIATCWLEQLGSSRRATNLNIERALEAFHHLLAAGDADRVNGIAVELFTGNLEWAKRRMKALGDHLYETKAPNAKLLKVLEYRAILDPDDHSVQRFLGECWAREEGRGSAKALKCFEEACRLRRDFPQYWANLGRTLLAQGKAGAQDFLHRVSLLEQDCPQAINEHVRSIQSDCHNRVGDAKQAAALRMEYIAAGSRHPAFYNDEAKARLEAGNATGALEILNLADERGVGDEYTQSIRASVLQKTAPEKAAALRMEYINAASRHAAFYADEAKG